jgi:hypothetical protein
VQQESAVLEDVDTDDEWIDDMENSSKSSLGAEVGAWQGGEMDREGVENNTTGTIGFFNVDGLQVDGTAMEELALEAERTNCMTMGVCDHRSDYVDVRPRVQRAFDNRFGARPGEQDTTGVKGSFDMPIAVPRARGDFQMWASARWR